VVVVSQRGKADCSVACIATLLRMRYEVVLAAARRIAPRIQQDGAWSREVVLIVYSLSGRQLYTRRKIDLDQDRGILRVESPSNDHMVILRSGQIYDPLMSAPMSAHRYLESQGAVMTSLLTFETRRRGR
jgi:hypothetical protein